MRRFIAVCACGICKVLELYKVNLENKSRENSNTDQGFLFTEVGRYDYVYTNYARSADTFTKRHERTLFYKN